MNKYKREFIHKTNQNNETEIRMKNNLKDFEAKNKELYEQLEKLKSLDVKKLSDIDNSQIFFKKI